MRGSAGSKPASCKRAKASADFFHDHYHFISITALRGFVPMTDTSAQAIDLLERQAERLPHFAQRAPPAIANHLRDHGGSVATVALVQLLNDLFAPFVLEIDVDVGRLTPFGAQKSLEQKIRTRRIHRRNAEREAHGAVCSAASALA